MCIYRRLRPLAFVLAFICSAPALSDGPEAVPEPIVAAWEARWNESTNELIADIIDGLREELNDVEEERRTRLLDDIDRLFRESVSWNALGEVSVRQLLFDTCGLTLLAEITPYFTGERPAEEIPEELNRRYYRCYSDVDLYVGTIPAYTITEVASRELRAVFLKNGVDPDRL